MYRKLTIGTAVILLALMISPALVFAKAELLTAASPQLSSGTAEINLLAHAGHHHGGGQAADREILYFLARIAYYAGLLVTAGLVLWRFLQGSFAVAEKTREKLISFAGKYMLLAALVYVVLSMLNLAQGEPLDMWFEILKDTTVGRQYAAVLLLGLAAPFLPQLGKVFGGLWAALFLALESWSGHASAYNPAAYTIGLDFVHLAASSLWAGGLVLLFAVWWGARYEAVRFARVFARFALISIAVLWITGILIVLAYLPSPDYLLYTSWGKWLIAKIIATLLVIVVAMFIRQRMRRRNTLSGLLLQADLGLLAVIVAVVGVFTYLSPSPQNAPFYFHKMGNDLHLTLRILPNEPGENHFTVKVWLPEQDGPPQQVQLLLTPSERGDSETIEVPLTPYIDQEFDGFPGFAKYTYESKGPYLPFADEWKAEVVVIDGLGKELRRETTFRIY